MHDVPPAVHIAIHGASVASAGVGAGLAQVPGSDAPVLASIQAGMVICIAQHYGISLTQTSAASFVLTFAASMAGTGTSQLLLGWIPGYGNALNATTAFAITEAIGFAANTYFSDPHKRDEALRRNGNNSE